MLFIGTQFSILYTSIGTQFSILYTGGDTHRVGPQRACPGDDCDLCIPGPSG